MEKNQEKMSIEHIRGNYYAQFYSSQDQQHKLHTCKRKIYKKHKKQTRRAVNHSQTLQTSPLQVFFQSQAILFTISKQKSLNQIFQIFKKEVHIRQILDLQGQCFANLSIQSCQQQASNYMKFLEQECKLKLKKIGLKNSRISVMINYLQDIIKSGDKQTINLHFVSSKDASFKTERLRQMQNIKLYIQRLGAEMGHKRVDICDFNAQLLTLVKIAKITQNSLLDRLSWTSVQEDYLWSYLQHPPLQFQLELKNRYITLLVLKNISEAFKEQQIDFYNYHRAIEQYEDNMYLYLPYQSITSLSAFLKYVLARKPKQNKNPLTLLRTPCSACLSPFSQLYNPIENCPECHLRVHRYCQKIENRCHRCRYGRTSNIEKSKTSFCYICNRPRQKGLMIQAVTNCAPHRFAHVFCLYLHNLWHVQSQEMRGEYMVREINIYECKFCGLRDGLHLQCQQCASYLHGMCGYFQGCSFALQSCNALSAKTYKIRINCCRDKKLRRRLSMQRRFKINLQKVIFRQDEQMLEYITQQMKQKY